MPVLIKIDNIVSFSNSVSGILSLIGFFVSVPSIIIACNKLLKFLWYKKTIINLIARELNLTPNELKMKLKTYEEHSLNSFGPNEQKSETLISTRNILKFLKEKNTITEGAFIIGEAGYGKSTLMQYLCYKYSLKKRTNVIKNAEITLGDIGVKYIDLGDIRHTDNMDFLSSLIEKIDDNDKRFYHVLFLDAFDEFRALENHVANHILDSIMKVVLKNTNKFRKIIISTRLEPIQGGISKLIDYRFNSSSKKYPFNIYKIVNFSNKQILNLYKKKGGTSNHLDNSPKRGKYTKGEYAARMKDYLSSHPNTVFQIPVLIEYSDSLFSELDSQLLSEMRVNDIYDAIINILIKREYDIVNKLKNSSETICFEMYKQNALRFIILILENMNTNKSYRIYLEDIGKIAKDFNYLDYNDLVTRHLMIQYIDNNFEFIHHSFYEYFFAHKLLDMDYEKKRIVMLNKMNENITDFYIHILISKKSDILDKVKDSIEYFTSNSSKQHFDLRNLKMLLHAEKVQLTSQPKINIDTLVCFFPLIQEIKISNGSLSGLDLIDFGENKYLDLSNQNLNNIDFLKYFGSFRSLDISENTIRNIDVLNNYPEIEDLRLNSNNIGSYGCLSKIKVCRLFVSISNESQLREIFEITGIEEYIVDAISNLILYILLYEKLLDKKNIKVFRRLNKIEIEKLSSLELNALEMYNKWLISAYRIELNSFSEQKFSTLYLGFKLGTNLTNQRRCDEGELILREVYELEKNSLGKKDKNTLVTGYILGCNLTDQKKYEESEQLLRDVYILQKETLGATDTETIKTVYMLGKNLTSQCISEKCKNEKQKIMEGETILRDVFELRKKIYGEKNTETLFVGYELGRNLDHQNKYEESEKILRSVYEFRKEVLGEKDFSTLTTGYLLGRVLDNDNKYSEAEEILRITYRYKKEISGLKDNSTLLYAHELGRNLTEQKKYVDGEEILQEVYSFRKELLGMKHIDTILSGFQLGNNLEKQKKYREAEIILREVYYYHKEILGEKNIKTLYVGDLLGTVLYALENFNEEGNILREVFLFKKETLGEKAKSTLITGRELGRNLTSQEKYEEGENILRDVFKIMKDTLGDKVKSTLSTGYELGRNLLEQKKIDEGENILREVYCVQKEILGEDNPDTTKTKLLIEEYYSSNV